MIPSKYFQEAVKNFVIHLKEHRDGKYALLKESDNPFVYNYDPEVYVSKPLDADMASYCQHIIGIMWCIFELGHVDIETEVSILSFRNAHPREEHFEDTFHII